MSRVTHLTLPQAAKALGRTRQWAARMVRRGQFAPVVVFDGSPLRRVAITELEKRFGPIAPDAIARAIARPHTGV
jgi:hypothetical protein